jgi:hypothetical protein
MSPRVVDTLGDMSTNFIVSSQMQYFHGCDDFIHKTLGAIALLWNFYAYCSEDSRELFLYPFFF